MADRPLRIYQVLEEEYERLHGEPSPSVDPDKPAEERLKNIIRENHERQHAAICLSGGGIRSATFGLGVLQGLAHNGLLNKFSYISTVSGGGYVGGWFSAWIHREEEGLGGVEKKLPSENPSDVLNPEPEPITHLRNYSNYLTPRLGLLSPDTWTLVAIVIRNLLLNWLVLIPLMIAVLALPRLFVSLSQLSPPGYLRVTALVVGIVLGVQMICYVAISRPTITKTHRNQKSFLKWCFFPMLISAILFALYWSWHTNAGDLNWERSLTFHRFDGLHPAFGFMAFGVLLHLAAFFAYTWFIKRSALVVVLEIFGLLVNGAVGGLLLWLVTSRLFPHPSSEWWRRGLETGLEIRELLLYSTLAVPIYLVMVFLALSLFVGIASRWSEDEDREWWARFGGWILIAVVVWTLGSFLVLLGPHLASYWVAKYVMPAGGLTGMITALLGRSAKLSAKGEKASGWMATLMRYALPLGAMVFAAVLILSLSIATNHLFDGLATVWRSVLRFLSLSSAWLHSQSLGLPGGQNVSDLASPVVFPSTREVLLLMGLTGGLGLLLARFINTNKFSHHAMYRNRLIRAYLGASRQSEERHPDRFTGFDPDDNVSMAELRPEMLHTKSFTGEPNGQPGFSRFVERLSAKKDPASIHIVSSLLSAQTIRLLNQCAAKRAGDHSYKLLQSALIRDLNKALLQETPILPKETQKIAGSSTPKTTDAFVWRNRRALEAAFEQEIRAADDSARPLHLINMTLNLVHGDRLAWQQRKAASFTVSPLHCGSFQIPDTDERTGPVYGCYRRTSEYGGGGGISMGTAMAISGAAVSPNMGYYSSPVVTFLMTLFNVRLGWWLGNPGPAGKLKPRWYHKLPLLRKDSFKDYYALAHPKSAVYPIIAEALGLTDDKNNYVYLSDGGHFENLGLYEMVLRRCRLIVVSDAACDSDFQFNDLGNAVQKIRTDLGIPIEFQPMQVFPRKDKKKGAFCAVGTIRYSAVDEKIPKILIDKDGKRVEGDLEDAPDGTIIYVKPVFYGDEPRDIYRYAMTHETFPHESTGDQWFDESQFESYRKLGSHIIDTICKYEAAGGRMDLVDTDLGGFVTKATQGA
jgi:hypothetical protein